MNNGKKQNRFFRLNGVRYSVNSACEAFGFDKKAKKAASEYFKPLRYASAEEFEQKAVEYFMPFMPKKGRNTKAVACWYRGMQYRSMRQARLAAGKDLGIKEVSKRDVDAWIQKHPWMTFDQALETYVDSRLAPKDPAETNNAVSENVHEDLNQDRPDSTWDNDLDSEDEQAAAAAVTAAAVKATVENPDAAENAAANTVSEQYFDLNTTPGKIPTITRKQLGYDDKTKMYVDLDGKFHKDLFGVSYIYQMPTRYMIARMRIGATREEALLIPIGAFHASKLSETAYKSRYGYHINGTIVDDVMCHWAIEMDKWFPTLAAMCRYYGTSVGYFRAAVDVGCSWGDAMVSGAYQQILLKASPMYRTNRSGKTVRVTSVYRYCRELHIAPRTLYKRVAAYWKKYHEVGDIDAMIADIISKHRPRPSIETLISRGYDPEKKVYVDPKGHTYTSFERMCLRYYKRVRTVLAYMRKGMTIKEALIA